MTQTNAVHYEFPTYGFVRLKELLKPTGPIRVSRSKLYEMVRDGKFPPPLKLSPRISAWNVEHIREYIANPETWGA